jgi:hypothetical protein
MRIFALETDTQKLIQSFLSPGETVVLFLRFSAFLFILKTIVFLFLTAVFVAIGYALSSVGLPPLWVWAALAVLWLVTVFYPWLCAFIDWRYDFILLTSKELVFVDQSFIFHASVRQLTLDSVVSVTAESQYAHLFGFGQLRFDIDGSETDLAYGYVPKAELVANVISDAL